MTLWYSKHILSYIEGSQKCIFNAFNASAILLSDRFVTAQQQQQEGVWNSCSWMKMSILVSNPFQHTYNHNIRSKVHKKNSQKADRKGGGRGGGGGGGW